MVIRISVCVIPVALIVMGWLATPVRAAGECRDQDTERQITACTRDIESGALRGKSLAEAYMFRGRGWSRKADFDHALADFSEALRLDPTFAAAMNDRATVWFRKGQFDRAIADFEVAVRLNPKDGAIRCNLGRVLHEKGEFDRAIIEYTEAVRIDSRVTFCVSNRGEVWRLKGDLDRALADQNEAIRTNPKIALAYVQRGDTLRYRGDLARALVDYEHALQMEAEFVPALTGRGLTYEKMGDLARARVEFQKALASHHRLAKVDVHKAAQETASAQLAAIDSGAPLPVIPNAPARAASATAIPTPTATALAPTAGGIQGRRIALVIGNSAYKNAAALPNPQRDAEAIAAAFRAIGFETVTLVEDATHQTLIDALRTFADQAEAADWAVVYYAGHGIEVNGVNYLIPVDAKIAVDRDVQFEAVRLDQIMTSVDNAKKLKLILLDACRNNPFVPQMRRTAAPDAVAATTGVGSTSTRSIGRGLGEVNVSGATLVVYAAKHGQVALDGEGGNSPFAVAVVQRLATPGVEINKLFRLVRDDVMEATAGRQEPFTYGSLPGREDFFFVQR
jgi:tetratricopeptide (TPR) repeat protein